MSRQCAYCRSITNKLTREHVWPRGIISRVPSYVARFSEPANKVFGGDLVICDVCERCNNGPLASLDTYACRLYDRYFYEFHERGSSLEFEYDWTQLGRWLLKISYNSARGSGSHATVLARFASTILGVDPRPPDMAIWLDLVEPSYLQDRRDARTIEVERGVPAMTRVCRINFPGPKLDHYIVRLVAINAFYFYLAIPTNPYSGVHDELRRIVEFFSLMSCLDPDDRVVLARTTGLTTMHLIGPHTHQKRELYEDFCKRQRGMYDN